MVVKKWITVETEVSVHISEEDVADALNDTEGSWSRALNNCATLLKSVSDEKIKAMTDGQRDIVALFLRKEAERYLQPVAKEGEAKP